MGGGGEECQCVGVECVDGGWKWVWVRSECDVGLRVCGWVGEKGGDAGVWVWALTNIYGNLTARLTARLTAMCI